MDTKQFNVCQAKVHRLVEREQALLLVNRLFSQLHPCSSTLSKRTFCKCCMHSYCAALQGGSEPCGLLAALHCLSNIMSRIKGRQNTCKV